MIKVKPDAEDILYNTKITFDVMQTYLDDMFEAVNNTLQDNKLVKSKTLTKEQLKDWIFDYLYNSTDRDQMFTDYLIEHKQEVK